MYSTAWYFNPEVLGIQKWVCTYQRKFIVSIGPTPDSLHVLDIRLHHDNPETPFRLLTLWYHHEQKRVWINGPVFDSNFQEITDQKEVQRFIQKVLIWIGREQFEEIPHDPVRDIYTSLFDWVQDAWTF